MLLEEAVKQVTEQYATWDEDFKKRFIGISGHGLTITKEMLDSGEYKTLITPEMTTSKDFGIKCECSPDMAEAFLGLLEHFKETGDDRVAFSVDEDGNEEFESGKLQ